MSILSNEFKEELLEKLLNLVWQHWSTIGVPGYSGRKESVVIDPEALLMLTLTVGRYDARLFDEVLEWLEVNGAFVNVHRLQKLIKQFGYQAKPEISAVASVLSGKSDMSLKWKKLSKMFIQAVEAPLFFLRDGRPMPTPKDCDETFKRHGLLRPVFKRRELATPFPREGMAALLLRLRALLGVNMRSEILCVLGSVNESHPSYIAKLIGQNPRSTQNVLSEMARSGVVQVRTSEREKKYALTPGLLDLLLRPDGTTPWLSSAPLFRALEIIWLGVSDPKRQGLDPMMSASEWRRLARRVRPLLGDAGMGQPFREDSLFPGESYGKIFMEDVNNLLTRL